MDFYCSSIKLAIELDGGQHNERKIQDKIRDKYLEKKGVKVLRFWNNEVHQNIDGVLTMILGVLEETPS